MSSLLNKQQQEAVDTLSGQLLLLAGAGTGKTTVIVRRIANLLAHGTDPSSILAVTFTNKAAREMRERIAALSGAPAASAMTISTFHAFCVRVLRQHIDKLGYSRRFTIASESYQQGLIVEIMSALQQTGQGYDALLWRSRISLAKANCQWPEDVAQADYPKADEVAEVYAEYQKRMRQMDLLDFDDLLCLTVKLWEEHPDVLERYRSHYTQLMIDEYQDTNGVQLRLMTMLAGPDGNIAVVGDDDQSIYGWRGADITNILHFDQLYPKAKIIRLEQNYRSTNIILKAANSVIANNKERHVKNLWSNQEEGQPITAVLCPDETQEAEFITRSIQDAHLAERRPWKEFAVLFRSNRQSRALEDAFKKARIPHVLVGTTSFYQAKEILDAGAFLQAAANPGNDLAFMRIVNVPPRGIGDATIEKLRQAREIQHRPMQLLARDESLLKTVPPEAAAALRSLTAALREARHTGETPCQLAPLASRLFQAVDYMDGIVRMYKPRQNALERRENVMEFLSMLADFDVHHQNRGTLSMLLDQLDLEDAGDRTSDRKKPQPDAVTLMTVHASKGLEFPVVYLAGMERNLFPHQRAVEDGNLAEERRLFYVAITRAKKRLWLTYAGKRREGQAMLPRVPSPFLDELPDDCVQYRKPQDTFSKISQQEALDILLGSKDLF